MPKQHLFLYSLIKIKIFFSSTAPVTNTALNTEDVTVTSNSTQTPSDLSPLPINEELLPQAHHQNPGHCIASFAAIDQMRQNAQVSMFCREKG